MQQRKIMFRIKKQPFSWAPKGLNSSQESYNMSWFLHLLSYLQRNKGKIYACWLKHETIKFKFKSESLFTASWLNSILLEYLKFISMNGFYCRCDFPLFRLNFCHLLERHIKQTGFQAVFLCILMNTSFPSLLFGSVRKIFAVLKKCLFYLHCTSSLCKKMCQRKYNTILPSPKYMKI